ncbi:site-specific integrase [Oerskovia merdavium]|uniref:Site-specific integrase n=1 Tax=Oerskovia merdavium TaxID=2762227 RepID=A0ABR8TWR4_9CELL|nr:site-specific integrase [Oerskovia merdavium]MBD7980213.1 site-specific integrase [Oerskovia merdavium]
MSTAPSECSSGTESVNRHAEELAHATNVVRGYRPNAIRPEHWAPVAQFTCQVGLDLEPVDRRRATETMRTLSQFVVWAHRQGMPLDREAIFTPDMVERYIAVACGHLAESSRATRRSDLRRFSAAVTRKAPWPPRAQRLRGDYAIVPYTPAEVARLLEVAAHQRTALQRRRLTAFLALGLGTGVYPREARSATTDDLVERHGRLCLNISGEHARLVPISPPHDTTLAEICSTDPATPILGFAAKEWDRAPLGHLLEDIDRPLDCPDLKAHRLRATWLLRHLDNRVHLNGLAQMAGVSSWKTFGHLMAYLPLIDEESLFEELTRR